jgi:hypothetical protein
MHLATRQVVGRYPFGALHEYLGQGKNRNSITTFPGKEYRHRAAFSKTLRSFPG